MRWIWFLAAFAMTPLASAQGVNPLQSYGPYRFGMTIEEARAADPSLLGPEGLGDGLNTLLAPARPRFGVIVIAPVLSFREGRLNRVVIEGGNAVSTPEQCERIFDRLRKRTARSPARRGRANTGRRCRRARPLGVLPFAPIVSTSNT